MLPISKSLKRYFPQRSSTITCLLEDKNGNIYAGTDGGVWKYNGGESWSCITTSLTSSSNYITSLTEGVDGNIYMASDSSSRGGGIWKYDGKSWTGLNANLIGAEKTAFSFLEKSDGKIYAGSPEGVWEKTPTGWVDISGDMRSLSNDTWSNDLLEDNNGNILTAAANAGIWRYNGKIRGKISGNTTKENYSSKAMIKAKDGTIYIGSNEGLLKYDGNKISKIPDLDMTVNNLLEDDGLLYMSCQTGVAGNPTGQGMWTYDGSKFTNITASLSGDALDMLSIMKSKDGNIYTITRKCSLWAYDSANWKNVKASIPDEKIHAEDAIKLMEDSGGNIYLTPRTGFWKYDGSEWTLFASGPMSDSKLHIWGFMETKSGVIYAGKNGGTIFAGTPPKAAPQAPQKTTTPSGSRFTDVQPGAWYYDDVEYVVDKGLFSGTGANQFSPNMTLTRSMIVTVLGRLVDIDTADYKGASFADVDENAYYAPYVKWWAMEMEIPEGMESRKFNPDEYINRQDFTVWLNKYSEYMGYDLPVINVRANFADAAKISSYAREAVYIMQQAGVINGKENNMLDPMANITRAEFSAMLHRFMGLTTDDSVPKD